MKLKKYPGPHLARRNIYVRLSDFLLCTVKAFSTTKTFIIGCS